MSDKRKILIQLDSDVHASVFDRVVAVDAGVEELFSYGGVKAHDVQGLVHGAMFTRGLDDLKHTAVFVGGSNVVHGEELLDKVKHAFMGPFRVSAMLDANGANTTAAAAVLCAEKHVPLQDATVTVLGGTGPVGSRVALLCGRSGAAVRIASRWQHKADEVVQQVNAKLGKPACTAWSTTDEGTLRTALSGSQAVIAAGAAGVALLPREVRKSVTGIVVAIDLNAVAPAGIEGIDLTDKATTRDGVVAYGALGVGGLKMKIHKAAIRQLFTRNDQVLDAVEILEIGRTL
jgi:hypothetical protein